jgi:hypothetical protein
MQFEKEILKVVYGAGNRAGQLGEILFPAANQFAVGQSVEQVQGDAPVNHGYWPLCAYSSYEI